MKHRTQATPPQSPTANDETDDIAAWARPAYASAYRDYLLSGAKYGHSDEGMRRWMSEKIEQQRRAAKKAHRR